MGTEQSRVVPDGRHWGEDQEPVRYTRAFLSSGVLWGKKREMESPWNKKECMRARRHDTRGNKRLRTWGRAAVVHSQSHVTSCFSVVTPRFSLFVTTSQQTLLLCHCQRAFIHFCSLLLLGLLPARKGGRRMGRGEEQLHFCCPPNCQRTPPASTVAFRICESCCYCTAGSHRVDRFVSPLGLGCVLEGKGTEKTE